MTIDDRMHEFATMLSRKHGITFEEALEVLVFLNGFMLHNVIVHGDMLIASAKSWHIPPRELISIGLQVHFSKINEN